MHDVTKKKDQNSYWMRRPGRWKRWQISSAQRLVLEAYLMSHGDLPKREDRKRLAAETGTTEERVKVWFQNQRQRRGRHTPSLDWDDVNRLLAVSLPYDNALSVATSLTASRDETAVLLASTAMSAFLLELSTHVGSMEEAMRLVAEEARVRFG